MTGDDMDCLEIAINGERYCVAAAHSSRSLMASVAHIGVGDRGVCSDATTALSVHGFSTGFDTCFTWGSGIRSLAVGDTVTIRVVNARAADTPTASPHVLSGAISVRPVVIELAEMMTSDLLNRFPSPIVRSLLFWAALVILGLAIQWLV